ncbi:hypothetical protein BBP40_002586 [Aspergillus hancockii]|nr:hypothetical protein BBP40_002586 [Aspergillus hancockii]
MSRYAAAHTNPKGAGDARPTALKLIQDESKCDSQLSISSLIVASSAHRAWELNESDNYSFEKGGFHHGLAYANSKLATIYMANEIDRRYGDKGLHVTSLHPGAINTDISRNLGPEFVKQIMSNKNILRILKSPEQGAATTVLVAVGKEWENRGGKYLEDCEEAKWGDDDREVFGVGYVRQTYNPTQEERLWNDSLKMMTTTTLLQTRQLGGIRGKTSEGVTQFLGIKYATLNDRLADAQLVEKRDGNILDATKDGAPSNTHSQELPQSDIDYLNLSIAVPEGATASAQLPVLLFIHSRGLLIGANSWQQADSARFCQALCRENLPIVAVPINYRLGAFGFLTSGELRNAGYNGLRDQKVAMQWVQNTSRTLEALVTYHLSSEVALVKRAIAMSGSYLFTRLLPYEVHEQNYQQLMSALGLTNTTTQERIQALLSIPGEDLIAKLPPSILAVPAVDADIILSAPSFARTANLTSSIPKRKDWCTDLMIGDARWTNSTAHPTWKWYYSRNARRLALPAVLDYINDIYFFAPTLSFARGWRGDTYVYYFNEGNPWEGLWKDRATHVLGQAYLFQNFREFLTAAQQLVATRFAEDFLKFCHGIKPWPPVVDDDITTGLHG